MKRHPRSGVSLLETLIALAVMAMIALASAAMIGSTSQFLGRSGDMARAVEYALGRAELRRWLEAAVPPARGENGTAADFRGNADTMLFHAVRDGTTLWPGQAVKISLSTDIRGVQMQVEGVDENGEDVFLSRQLSGSGEGLSIAYLGRSEIPGWQSEWPPASGLPRLVRIVLAPGAGFPPMIVTPGSATGGVHVELGRPFGPD